MTPPRSFTRLLVLAVCSLFAAGPVARAQITFTSIADTNSTFINFGTPTINATGTVCFFAALKNGDGIFTSDGKTITPIALGSGPMFHTFNSTPSINAAGTVAFGASLDTGPGGIFVSDGRTPKLIVSMEPTFTGIGTPLINAAGVVGFRAFFAKEGSSKEGEGLYTSDGKTITAIALGDGSPYNSFGSHYTFNAAGTLGFLANEGNGLFASDGKTTRTIAQRTAEVYSSIGAPAINAAGLVAFRALLASGSDGLFVSDGTTTRTIAQAGPVFRGLGDPSINTAGVLAFLANVGRDADGIFTSDGTTTTPVIRTGDALFGSTVTMLVIGSNALNDAGQIVFRYALANRTHGLAVANLPGPGGAAPATPSASTQTSPPRPEPQSTRPETPPSETVPPAAAPPRKP